MSANDREMEDINDYCVGCGNQTVKKYRRLVADDCDVKILWKQLMMNKLRFSEAECEITVKAHKFMCRNCFNNYSRHVKSYETLKSKLEVSITTVGIHEQETEFDGQSKKRRCSSLDDQPTTSKRLKMSRHCSTASELPHVAMSTGSSSTTIVCDSEC